MLENRPATVDAPSASRSSAAEPPKRQRARRTNDPLTNLDMNTARGRRTADLVRAYLGALGHPTDIERQAAVIAAAELQVLAEEARSAALKQGAAADLDRVVRVQGAADRATRRLGIKPGAGTKPQSLKEYLAARGTAPVASPPVPAPKSKNAPEGPA
jgi:hypothetical protein